MSYIRPDPPSAQDQPPFIGQPDLACRDADPKMFYPPVYTGGLAKQAIAVCHTPCPYLDQCRDWATSTEQRFGIWGGTTPGQRLGERVD